MKYLQEKCNNNICAAFIHILCSLFFEYVVWVRELLSELVPVQNLKMDESEGFCRNSDYGD